MPNHTPGPWLVFRGPRPGIEGPKHSIICWGTHGEETGIYGETDEETHANAHLIAAAPDLLDALIDLRIRVHADLMVTFSKEYADLATEKALAAIVKATHGECK